MAKIYQLYYTRLGRQGTDAGWQVAATSTSTPQLVKNAFYKLASNLVAIGSGAQVPSMIFDLQILENYVFFSHINYHSINEGSETDSRGVSFVHGFAMKAEDYRNICHEPEQLLGVESSAITLNYNGVKELPLLDRLPFQMPGQEELLAKYHLDQAGYSQLMRCVYGAVGTVGGSLVICSSQVKGEALRGLFQEITCLVMRSLPYAFRMKISAFSGIRQGALLCFAEEVPEKGYYFNLDTGESRCPQIPEYEFMRQLSNLSLTPEQRTQFYDMLEQFTEVTYGGNYEALKPGHMELAYRAACKRTTDEELDEHTREAAALRAFKYDLLDEYYAHLIQCYVKADREFPSADVFKKLQKRYVDTACPELKTAFADYYSRKVCVPGEVAAYDMLYRMETAKPEDHQYLWKKLEEIRPEFLNAYYVDYYLERQVDSFEKLERMCRENPESLEGSVGDKLLEIMTGFFDREFAQADNNTQRHQVCRKYAGLCSCFPEPLQAKANACAAMFKEAYWKQFAVREFSYRNQKEYYDMGAGMAKNQVVPKKVEQLLDARDTFIQGPDIRNFQSVFLSPKVIAEEPLRKKLLKELHEEAGSMGDLPLDAYLLLNSSPDGTFDLGHLITDLRTGGKLQAGYPEVAESFRSSQILTPGSAAEEHLKAQVKEKAKDKNANPLIRELYQLYFPKKTHKNRGRYLFDLVQKCMLFLAVSLTYVEVAKYLMGENMLLGMIAAGVGAVAAIGGLILNLMLGETNSVRFLAEGEVPVLIGFIVYLVVSIGLVVAAALVSAVWMNFVMIAVVLLLLFGRLFLVLKAGYEII